MSKNTRETSPSVPYTCVSHVRRDNISYIVVDVHWKEMYPELELGTVIALEIVPKEEK